MRVTGRSCCLASAWRRRRSPGRPAARPGYDVGAQQPGAWALYPIGSGVVVVHVDGASIGPAAEVGRRPFQDRQGELDRQAAPAIQRLLTGDCADRASPRRLGNQILVQPGHGPLAQRPRQQPRRSVAGCHAVPGRGMVPTRAARQFRRRRIGQAPRR